MATKKYNGFSSWDEYLSNKPSYSILNFIQDECMFGICNESRKLMLPNETVIKFHQRMLGKQSFCWQGSNKNFIWEFETYRLFVNKNGRNIEVFSLNNNSIKYSLNEYIKSIGITLPLEDLYFKNYKFTP